MSVADNLHIDLHDLTTEWEQQPTLYHEIAVQHSDAILEQEKAKDHLELVRANVDAAVREALINADRKFTEAVVHGAVIQHKDYQKAQAELNDAEHTVGILAAGRSAFEHKKSALEFLTRMQLSDYNSEPKVPRATQEQANEQGKEEHLSQLNRGKTPIKKIK